MNQQRKAPQDDPGSQFFFDFWQEWYEKEWKPVFNVPQLGLTRYYQEHINQSVDKYCQLQGTVAQFASLLFQPIGESFWDTQAGLSLSDLKNLDDKEAKGLYANWVSVLEKRYMELYRSPDFIQCFNKAMATFNDFLISERIVLEDLLKLVPVPTHSDMDGLYKEIYELKKRVRDLEKKQLENR